jgi:hypothetical protein
MSVTINLSSDEVAQIKRFTELQNETEAVAKAAREFLRITQLRELNRQKFGKPILALPPSAPDRSLRPQSRRR